MGCSCFYVNVCVTTGEGDLERRNKERRKERDRETGERVERAPRCKYSECVGTCALYIGQCAYVLTSNREIRTRHMHAHL
jgi:hypothetical protein